MRRTLAFLLTSLCAAGCSCGGPTTARDYFIDEYNALCDLYARCGYIAKSEQMKCAGAAASYYDNDLSQVMAYDIEAAQRAGRLSIDPGAASRCLSDVQGSRCSSLGSLVLVLDDCLNVYHGNVAPGGACQSRYECSKGTCQPTSTGNMCSGICVAYAAEGSSCDTTDCDPKIDFCDSSKVCRPRGAIGAACTSEFSAYAQCQPGLGCANGSCARPGGGGQPCASGACQSGFHCATTSSNSNGVCAADVTHGQSCPDALACPDGDRCVISKSGLPGVCTTVLELNASCDPNADACPFDAPCDKTALRCTPPAASTVGAACTSFCTGSFGPSAPLYCDSTSHTCQKKLAAGSSCNPQTTGNDPCLTTCSSSTNTCVAPTCTL